MKPSVKLRLFVAAILLFAAIFGNTLYRTRSSLDVVLSVQHRQQQSANRSEQNHTSAAKTNNSVTKQHVVRKPHNSKDDVRVQGKATEDDNKKTLLPASAGDGELYKTARRSEEEYMKRRRENFYSWFEGNNKTAKLIANADANGTIIDFAIVGFPKCGTTTLEANLGYLAPMPIGDVCTPVAQTVYYAYKNWPKQYGGEEKLLRGTKCPAFIQGPLLSQWSKHLPRTKLIVGIRHPISWFQSFWNMQAANMEDYGIGPYIKTDPCSSPRSGDCRNGCPRRQLFCLHRGRFHLALAALGKTALTDTERMLLAPDDLDGGANLPNHKIKNPVFIYEQGELSNDRVWDGIADYLGVPSIPHDRYHSSHGKNSSRHIDFCDDEYDAFRQLMMPYAYELSRWLLEYLIPVAKDESRTDVVIPETETFSTLVEEYRNDPCGKLVRLDDGAYALPEPTTTST